MPAATPDKPGKIYVGNLPPALEKSVLQEAFSKYGDIADVLMVVDRETGASKGFAFVTYSTPKDANDAVAAMNEKNFMGKVLKVDHALMAISRQLRGRGGGDRGRGRGGPRGGLLGGPPRGGFHGPPRGGRGGFPPRGGFRGGPPRGRGGPAGRFNGPQGRGGRPSLMGGGRGDEYGEEMDMRRGGRGAPRGRGRGEPLLQQPPSLLSEDYSGRPERDDYRAPPASRAPPRDEYGQSSYGSSQATDSYYGSREPATEYGAVSGSSSRDYPETRADYAREDPYAAGRDRYGASRDPQAREPLSREPPPPAREPAPRDPLSREPRGYERESYSREYSSATRDAYAAPARDPYSAPAATERSSYEYPTAREDPYAARAAPAADSRTAYEEPRRETPREYERPAAERGYGKEYAAYGAEPARAEDPYSRAAPEREYGGSASASRYEGYGSRDPYTRTERTEKAPYGSRDPYGSTGGSAASRTGRNSAPVGGAGARGYERRY